MEKIIIRIIIDIFSLIEWGRAPTLLCFMSQHPSLKGSSSIVAKRSVLKRFERVDLLKKRSQWKEGQRVLGLPKTKPDA